MKLAFTTLACPDWDVETIVGKAKAYGYDGVDFRGTKEGLDITTQAAFTSGIANTRSLIKGHGIIVSGISSSLRICDRELFDANVEEARRTVPLALELGAEQVRVFGYGDPAKSRAVWIDQARQCMDAIFEIDGADQINWLLEMHDYWIYSDVCLQLMNAIEHRRFKILWDVGHTSRIGGETVEATFGALGESVLCVHLKDAIEDASHPQAMKDGWRYVLPGRGQLPLAEAVSALKKSGYDGWYVFEHEKRWHRELEEPDVALPAYVDWVRGV
ncbi:AP endonuclease, family 2 [Verrucomicrobiia bacterium DG1235]|nr:AP endonuclease, family 2 [Verrucomicrobiae bacterium DG1235]